MDYRKYAEFSKKFIATMAGGAVFVYALSDKSGHLDPPPHQVNMPAVSTTTILGTSTYST
jgi:hypothetical protein